MKSTRLKRNLLRGGLLYAILDEKTLRPRNNILATAGKLARYGTDILQLRAKDIDDSAFFSLANDLKKIIHKHGKYFIINDRVDIAYLSGADGLHLGSDDIPVLSARKLLGKNKLIGKTVHSAYEMKSFNCEDVDYLSCGPVFKTETKSISVRLTHLEASRIIKQTDKLIFAIGGINLYNIKSLIKIGINNVAVGRGLTKVGNFKKTVQDYKLCLAKTF
ncbi:MAG: thiamine phosphate synthase [Candidatus Omnitrophica bacterium]|nr:thiamine phosphate synthase [Candidatus Omnitrophota bacterium]MDD5429717.1 thiamine phosphate synthase [Candidatus Omnitrophota bacterium]